MKIGIIGVDNKIGLENIGEVVYLMRQKVNGTNIRSMDLDRNIWIKKEGVGV